MSSFIKSAFKRKAVRSKQSSNSDSANSKQTSSVVPEPKVGVSLPQPPPDVDPVDAHGIPSFPIAPKAPRPWREGSPHPSPTRRSPGDPEAKESKRDGFCSANQKPLPTPPSSEASEETSKIPVRVTNRVGVAYGYGQELNAKVSSTPKQKQPAASTSRNKGKEPIRGPVQVSKPGKEPDAARPSTQNAPALMVTPPTAPSSEVGDDTESVASTVSPASIEVVNYDEYIEALERANKEARQGESSKAPAKAHDDRIDPEEASAIAVECELIVQGIRRELKLASLRNSPAIEAANRAKQKRLEFPLQRKRWQTLTPKSAEQLPSAAASRQNLRDRLSSISTVSLAAPGELSEEDLQRTLTEAEACLAEARKLVDGLLTQTDNWERY